MSIIRHAQPLCRRPDLCVLARVWTTSAEIRRARTGGRPSAATGGCVSGRGTSNVFPSRSPSTAIPGHRQDKLFDNSLDGAQAPGSSAKTPCSAQAKADRSGRRSRIPPLRATYAIVREALEASIAARVCRNELWTVSQFVNGWQVQDGYIVTIQPVGTDAGAAGRAGALERLPHTSTPRSPICAKGIKAGLHRAEKQRPHRHRSDEHADRPAPIADSPFDSPSVRDKTPAFVEAVRRAGEASGSIRRSRATATSSSANICRRRARRSPCRRIPNGAACYDASVRYHSSLPMPAREVHATGLQQIDAIDCAR